MPGINDTARPRVRFFILFPTTFHEERVFLFVHQNTITPGYEPGFFLQIPHVTGPAISIPNIIVSMHLPLRPSFVLHSFSLTPNYIRFAPTKCYSKIGYFQHTPSNLFCLLHNSSSLNTSLLEISWDLADPTSNSPPPPLFILWKIRYRPPFDPRLFVHHSIPNTGSADTFDTFVKLKSPSPTQSWRNRTTPQTNKNDHPFTPWEFTILFFSSHRSRYCRVLTRHQ